MRTAKRLAWPEWTRPFVVAVVSFAVFAALAEQAWCKGNVIASPLLRPNVISLNGDWHFREDSKNVGEAEAWFRPGTVRGRVSPVPLPWQLAFEDLREYLGTAWYEKSFSLPGEAADKRVTVEFEAADHTARVWVNGTFVGKHGQGLTPFALDISEYVRPGGENTITVEVTDPEIGTRWWIGDEIVRFSGLWRDVRIVITEKTYIADVYMVPDIDDSSVEARINVASPPSVEEKRLTLRLSVKTPNGKRLAHQSTIQLAKSSIPLATDVTARIKLRKCVLWELDNPALYDVTASLLDDTGRVIDSASASFGMRKVETRGNRIYLNNKPLYLVGGWLDPCPHGGAGDVNWNAPPPYAPLSDEEIKRDILLAKSLGVNTVRRIMRPVSSRFLYWADRLGMLVWEGGPFAPADGIASRAAAEEFKGQLEEIVREHRNHPSLIVWELFCETIGLGETTTGRYRSWVGAQELLSELHEYVKKLDPTRLVLDVAGGWALYDSNYAGNHARSDLEDVCFLGAANTSWIQGTEVFQEYCQRIRSYGKPVTNSLMHNLTSRIFDLDKARERWGGKDAWWFNVEHYGLAGYEDRFHRWGLDRVYGNFGRFTELSDWYQFEGLKFQIEEMRKNPEMAGYLLFLFDCAPHFIGCVDPFRDKKVFFEELSRINSPDLVIVECEKRNFWCGETLRAEIFFSHFGKGMADGCTARWWLEGTNVRGEVRDVRVGEGGVRRIGEIELEVPEVDEARSLRLKARVERGRKIISENYVTVQIFPLRYREPPVKRINVCQRLSPHTRHRFDVLGYERSDGFDPEIPVAVTTDIDGEALEYLSRGGTVILLVCEGLNLMGFSAKPRIPPAGDFLQRHSLTLVGESFSSGGWPGSHFLKRADGLFDRIPFESPLGWPFHRVLPEYMILGHSPEASADLLAGGYGTFLKTGPVDLYGHSLAGEVTATIAQFRYGKGRLIISTFNLLEPLVEDPVATIMLNDLIYYATTSFQPTRNLLNEETQ